jgi:predicted DCC family thiol-disulfide oxidoreductase YuxK
METVFYDGNCGLCHATVRFVVARDSDARFVYAPLGGATFAATFDAAARAAIPATVVVRTEDGRTLVRSDAVVHLLRAIGGGWRVLGGMLRLVPRPLRDVGYRAVASVRRRLVAAPKDACPVVPPELRARFLA